MASGAAGALAGAGAVKAASVRAASCSVTTSAARETGRRLDDGGDALLHAALAKGRAQRQGTRAHLLQPQEGAGVGAAALAGGGAQGLFVAGELEIAVGERQHHPDERIEPVQAGSDGQRRLEERVEARTWASSWRSTQSSALAVKEVEARGQEDDGAQKA